MNAVPKPLKGMPQKFDYKYLNSEQDHVSIKRIKNEITILLGSKNKNFFRIGELLIEAKGILPYRLFIPWIETELPLSRNVAQRYMKVTKNFGDKSAQVAHLSFRVLYELTKPSIPQHIIDATLAGTYIPSDFELRTISRRQKPEKEPPIMIHSEQAQSREATIQDLAEQLAHMQQQITALPPQVQEVIKYVIPPEVQEELEIQRKEASKWHTEWEKIVEDRRTLVEKNQYLTQECNAIMKDRNAFVERYETLAKENEILNDRLSKLLCSAQHFIDDWSRVNRQSAFTANKGEN